MPANRHLVAVLALPSVVPFDLGVPLQVFGYPRPDLGAIRYKAVLCGVRRGPVMTSQGFPVVAPAGLEALRRAQTIIVPGVDDLDLPIPAAVTRALRAAHARGTRIAAICTGAFALAEAGLLDGRRATTHWIDAPELIRRYPDVRVDADVLYVDEGRILTSAGIAAGVDLCLHLVRRDHGAALANTIARRLVVPPLRDGGQAQYIAAPVIADDGGSLDRTRSWALARLDAPLDVPALARHAKLPVRTFARRFRAECGTTPLQWLTRQRVLRAQQLLETTRWGIERVASSCGLGSAVTLRAQFRRTLGTSPVAYRRTFQAAGSTR
ncbi:MAG: helix-turn-helix domain-containing protein [Gemmatimonadaceae bacterium]|nr:helix-turn-helix domain-containing protein [Gemmatimonadaceae bacterium]MCW5827214.1 helix-turn-helix domain-containing protein [Gemmatimonadaceae bacterium]